MGTCERRVLHLCTVVQRSRGTEELYMGHEKGVVNNIIGMKMDIVIQDISNDAHAGYLGTFLVRPRLSAHIFFPYTVIYGIY